MKTFRIHANVEVDNEPERIAALAVLQDAVRKVQSPIFVTVGSSVADEADEADGEYNGPGVVDECYHTDETMSKVYKVLYDHLSSQQDVIDLVSALQNEGILFRERVPS